MSFSWPRRSFLTALAATGGILGGADKTQSAPSELRRLRDPATEFELLRLTDPARARAILPSAPLRPVSHNNNSLLYCSDRSGSMQVWRMDLKTGESRQLTSAEAVLPDCVSLLPDNKSFVFADRNQVSVVQGNKLRTVYRAEGAWQISGRLALGDDGVLGALAEERSGRFRLRVFGLGRTSLSRTLFEADQPVEWCRVRPKRPAVLYNAAGTLTLANPDGRDVRRLSTAPDRAAGWGIWSADGKAVQYLALPRDRGTVQLREHIPDTGEDQLIGPTTQFIRFARNADSTVFAGISGSKASPYVLLLVRAAHRELTLAEHKLNDPAWASIAFSPNSQRLFYTSDREGKPAIYSIGLERFVEDTEATENGLD